MPAVGIVTGQELAWVYSCGGRQNRVVHWVRVEHKVGKGVGEGSEACNLWVESQYVSPSHVCTSGQGRLTCNKALAPLDGESIRCSGCRWISSSATWETMLQVSKAYARLRCKRKSEIEPDICKQYETKGKHGLTGTGKHMHPDRPDGNRILKRRRHSLAVLAYHVLIM